MIFAGLMEARYINTVLGPGTNVFLQVAAACARDVKHGHMYGFDAPFYL